MKKPDQNINLPKTEQLKERGDQNKKLKKYNEKLTAVAISYLGIILTLLWILLVY